MQDQAIRYVVLRDQRHWDESVSTARLVQRIDGVKMLQSLPGLASAHVIRAAGSFNVPPSGVACSGRRVYTAITSDPGSICIAECGCTDFSTVADSRLGIELSVPRGLLIVGTRLFVADSASGRVLVLDLTSLRQLDEWTTGLQQPAVLAADGQGWIYVLDIATNAISRFDFDGKLDATFDTAMAAAGSIVPSGLAIDDRNRLYVSDASYDTILRVDPTAVGQGAIPAPVQSAFKPRALIVLAGLLFVADAQSGQIWVYDVTAEEWLEEPLRSYVGPISAFAADERALYVKPGLDDTVYRLDLDAVRTRDGILSVGPVDAGDGDAWERIWVDAEIPDRTEVTLEVAVGDDSSAATGALAWKTAPALDALLTTVIGGRAGRYLWVRVTLKSLDGRSTPTLLQVQAATVAPSYIDYLPAIYRRDDKNGFLERLLALARAELGDWERSLDDVPRDLDCRTVAEHELDKLAAWLAFELPPCMDALAQRQLLAYVAMLYRRRGTSAGIRDLVRQRLGATIHIYETFRERRVWQLGEASVLGIDTRLPAGSASGFIVPGRTYADSDLFGLRGDYYEGTSFDVLRYSRIDSVIEFNWGDESPLKSVQSQAQFPKDYFTIRWSGQIRAHYSETYTFRTTSKDGVRLAVGGRTIIDNWTGNSGINAAGGIQLESNRWYPIVLEYRALSGTAFVELRWSSPSQRPEIVPQDCLYAMRDESAEIEIVHAAECTSEVGVAVVGQSRPQPSEEYGAALVDDYAHLFSVVVPAAHVPLVAQREALRSLIEAEKPAHTDFDLCLVEPSMRVGIQARVGIDSIVGGPGTALRLNTAVLGSDSYLSGSSRRERSPQGAPFVSTPLPVA